MCVAHLGNGENDLNSPSLRSDRATSRGRRGPEIPYFSAEGSQSRERNPTKSVCEMRTLGALLICSTVAKATLSKVTQSGFLSSEWMVQAPLKSVRVRLDRGTLADAGRGRADGHDEVINLRAATGFLQLLQATAALSVDAAIDNRSGFQIGTGYEQAAILKRRDQVYDRCG